MTMRDVKAYTAPEREPTRVGYRGLDVYSMGPPSSGGSTDGEALNILDGFDLDPSDRGGTSSSRPRASHSPIGMLTWPIPTSSTCRSRACFRRDSRPSAGR